MSKLEEFKVFVRKNPSLINYVKNDEMTWQKFYEIYDLFGENNDVWNSYITNNNITNNISNNMNNNINSNNVNNTTNNTRSSHSLSDIIDMAKNIDVDKVQSGITSLQKALGLVSDLFVKDNKPTNNYQPRPLYRSFED